MQPCRLPEQCSRFCEEMTTGGEMAREGICCGQASREDVDVSGGGGRGLESAEVELDAKSWNANGKWSRWRMIAEGVSFLGW